MADWDLLGGDPAPGSPAHVDAAAATFNRIGTAAEEVGRGLTRAEGDSAIAAWKGAAADQFRRQLGGLPRDLNRMSGSYRAAADALRRYSRSLSAAQQEAVRARELATQADRDARTAAASRDAAQSQMDAITRRLVTARLERERATVRYNLATDPAEKSRLSAAAQAARATVLRLEADLRAARSDRDRHQRARDESLSRLRAQKAVAQRIQKQMAGAASGCAAAIRRAEGEARSQSWLQRTGSEAARVLDRFRLDAVGAFGSLGEGAQGALQSLGARFAAVPEIVGFLGLAHVLTRGASTVGRYTNAWRKVIDAVPEAASGLMRFKRSDSLWALKRVPGLRELGQLGDSMPVQAIGGALAAISAWEYGNTIGRGIAAGDGAAVASGTADATSLVLKSTKNPVLYLTGANISIWKDVFSRAGDFGAAIADWQPIDPPWKGTAWKDIWLPTVKEVGSGLWTSATKAFL